MENISKALRWSVWGRSNKIFLLNTTRWKAGISFKSLQLWITSGSEGDTSEIMCVKCDADEMSARERFSVLLYVQGSDGATLWDPSNREGWGGACRCWKSVTPDWAARLQMWTWGGANVHHECTKNFIEIELTRYCWRNEFMEGENGITTWIISHGYPDKDTGHSNIGD